MGEAGEREKEGGRAIYHHAVLREGLFDGRSGGTTARRQPEARAAMAAAAGADARVLGREAAAAWGETPRVWVALIGGCGGVWACGPEA
jgi:hypothetical protein